MSKPASLKFGPGEPSGFTNEATASFNDVPPARILRELLQNSLDAAVEAGRRPATVRFELSVLRRADLPDLAGYEDAFRAATEYHRAKDGRLSDPADQVVTVMEEALMAVKNDYHWMLSVLDNGIGFDEKRMTAVLSDGSGAKAEGAAGSYGVGHFSAVAASDLRYVLYGGAPKQGKRIASGFAILASRPGKKHPISARGFLVKRLFGGHENKLFSFLSGEGVPPVVNRALSDVRKAWGHGSVVMIPGFNYFGYEGWLADIVTRVAAFNFSAAIHAGDLVVEVDETAAERGTKTSVNADTLAGILEAERERVRAFRSDTWYRGLRPSGQNAWAAYQALLESQSLVPTMVGEADVRVLHPVGTGKTRLDLFRNGMWITDDIPDLNPSIFADYEPFQAVLMPKQGTELHRLIRKAEGPMHDQLVQKLLRPAEREQLQTACRGIAAWVKNRVPKRTVKAMYTPDDFLVVASGGDGGVSGASSFSMWGAPVVVQRARLSQQRTDGGGEEADVDPDGKGRQGQHGERTRRQKTAPKKLRPLPFRSTGVPGGQGRYNIEIESRDAIGEVLLKFRIDENTDATSDRLWPDEDVELRSFRATARDGTALAGKLEDGNTTIRLRGLTANTYTIAIEYVAPAGFDAAVQAPVFRVDLHKSQG